MIAEYVTSTYEITDAYQKILLDAKEAKVEIEASSNDTTKLVFFEDQKRRYVFDVQNGTLTVRLRKTKWYNFLRIGFKRSEIKICVPESILEALTVKATVGCVAISSIVCTGDISVQTNTGKVTVCDTSCKAFHSKTGTGNVVLSKLMATDTVSLECNTGKISLNDCNAREFLVKTNTGKVSLNDCNAREFLVKTNTGNVFGKLPSNTVFAVKTHTGKIETPKTAIGEVIGARCEIKTNTGNIKFVN